jgi:hypothetical protein
MSPIVSLRPNPPGIAVARKLICEYVGRDISSSLILADRHCKTTPQVEAALRQKSAVGAGATTTSHNLDDLAPSGLGAEAFTLLQSASIFGRLLPLCRRGPFHTKFPKETGTGAGGAWRGEGLPRPLARTTTDTVTQEHYEAGIIIPITAELMRFGRTTEVALQRLVIDATAKFVDGQLLDPSVSASSAHPAAITNGAPEVTSAGTTAANVITDLTALLAALATPGDSLRWVMRPMTYYAILAKLAGVGMTPATGQLLGIPVILGSSSPQQITLVDTNSILASYDETMDVSISRETSLEMLDSSLQQTGIVGTGAQMVSLFQSQLVAVKAELSCAWQTIYDMVGSPAQASGVAFCSVGY